MYLSGCTSPSYEQAIIDLGVGLLIQPGSYMAERVKPFACWAADNACYPPDESWSPAKWLRMLGTIDDLDEETKAKCLYLLAPDMPCDHQKTVERFRKWLPALRVLGLPVAFAIQDGATVDTVPWDEFEVAFLAGSTEWKTGEEAYIMATEARRRGKWVHMGRVNSWERLDWASTIGCDSADGTFIKHGKPAMMVERIAVWLANDAPRLTQMEAQVAQVA